MAGNIEQGNGKVAFWLLTIALLTGAVMLVWRFIPAILWATVLSILLYPWYTKVQARFEGKKQRDTYASLWVTLLTGFCVIVPLLGLSAVGGAEIYNLASDLVADSPDGQITMKSLAQEADKYIAPWAERVGTKDFRLEKYLEENKSSIARNVYGPVTEGLKRLVTMVVTLVIAFLTTFFMLRDGQRLLEPTLDLVPLPREKTTEILKGMAGTVRSVFYSVVAVAFIQGLLAFILYWSLGVPNPMAWWALTTVAAMIPLLGAPVVYVPAAVVLFFTGHAVQGVVLLALGFGVISQVDNFLRPYFISMGSKLHMMAIFFSLLGGVLTLGPIGLMAGPMLLTLLLGLLDVLRESRRLAES